jgi:hypothetical protein
MAGVQGARTGACPVDAGLTDARCSSAPGGRLWEERVQEGVFLKRRSCHKDTEFEGIKQESY